VVKHCPSVLFEPVVADVGLDRGKIDSRNQPVLRACDLDPGLSLRVEPAKKGFPAF
jgi:hypothetical protein